MGKIVLLDDLTINQIAAGEVIERPANVVKELAENSIDAGAKNITIEVKNGGKTYIKVMDDGKGIAPDDMEISLERHATSKIREISDLDNCYSMGFRGEALASIASISKMTMITKTKEDVFGRKMVCKAGEILEEEQIGTKQGTTIIVEDLFFNTPVRYKFLKQDATEFRYIKELIQKMAIANLDISFKLINEGKTVFISNGNGNIKDVIYTLYGKELNDNISFINFEEGDIKVTGIIGNTLVSRDSRKDQIVFLNKRNIKNPIITNSADQAFKASIGIGKYGFYILNLEMPASYYDINVHPTKLEVRFKDEDKLYKIVYHAMKSAMLDKTFLGNSVVENNKTDYIENEYNFLTNHFNEEEKQEKKIENTDELIVRENKRKIEYKYLGILFKTYIIIEIDNEIYLIDQHAGHERILYEQIRNNYKRHMQNNTQLMLIPDVIDLTHKELKFVQENKELIKNSGFDIELFGSSSVKINGIPDIEYKADTKKIFLDILDEMITNERSSNKDVEERFIATVACKAAVKAHMDLSKDEVDNLIQDLLNLKNPFTCPHGRPTTVKISKEEIAKKLN